MKTNKLKNILLITLLMAVACKQDVLKLEEPASPAAFCDGATAGSANFSKFIAIGSSWTAGFQAGALFTAGQNTSIAAILNKDFECVGAPATFGQPTIGTDLGYNIFVSQDPTGAVILGRFLLQGASPKPTPQLSTLAALPNPQFNPSFIYNPTGKPALQNFSVEAITLGQFLIPNTGNWGDPTPSHGFSPFYARFASAPGTSTIIGDAAAAGGTFFLFWAGMDDFMLYAANGGDASLAPLTSSAAFTGRYNAAVNALLGSNAALKGVVANFPDIFIMPHFTAVSYNPIPLDQSTADLLNGNFGGYNQVLDGISLHAADFGLTTDQVAEIQSRKITFAASATNSPVIIDQSLINLGPYMDNLGLPQAQRDALRPYQQVRQTKSTDIMPLAAASVIGTLADPNNPLSVNGLAVPLADRYVITPVERDSINAARTAFNATVQATANGAPDNRLAFADINTGLNAFAAQGADVKNGVLVTFEINPPTGIFSEDGLHPNSRGYAYISNIIVNAINAKFGATVPQTDISLYGATALPIP